MLTMSLSFLLLLSCDFSKSKLKLIESIIAETKKDFVPDSRVAIFDVKVNEKDKITLTGETNLPDAKSELLKKITEAIGSEVIDKIELLPSASLEGNVFGVVRLSVCNIRSKPKHSSELSTQALLGTPLRIYKSKGDWFYVQTPDGYLGWLDNSGVELFDSEKMKNWSKSPKVIFKDIFGVLYQEPDIESQVVSDLVAGCIFQLLEEEDSFFKVRLPDSRVGYVEAKSTQKYDAFLQKIDSVSIDNILNNAKSMVGIPYLWGGTSIKGMDCSGFTKTVFFLNGLLLPRDASQQVNIGNKIELDKRLTKLKKGDLLFFGRHRDDGSEKITHVALYLGNGEIIHATGEVKIESLYEESPVFARHRLETLLQARRIVGAAKDSGVKTLKTVKYY